LCKYTNKLITDFKNPDLEILVATLNRNSLDFLIPMFPFCHFSEYSILVVNQTQASNVLVSEFDSVRVINSFEKGLSKSRNLALENTIGKIVLIADDDVVFLPDFQQNILEEYKQNPNVAAICFQTITTEGSLYSKYPKSAKELSFANLRKVLSIEVTCRVGNLNMKNCRFNELFGLGAQFQDSETFFFLRNIKHKGLKIVFAPKSIVVHKPFSSSDDASSDRVIYARMAGFYKRYSWMAYVLLLKYIFFVFRKYDFPAKEIKNKFNIGLAGINDYKVILNKKLDSSYE